MQHALDIFSWIAGGLLSLVLVLLGFIYKSAQDKYYETRARITALEESVTEVRKACVGSVNREAIRRLEKAVDTMDNRIDRLKDN